MKAIQYYLSIVEGKRCLNMSREGNVFPQSFLGVGGGGTGTPTPYKCLNSTNNERKERVCFQVSHLRPLHLGRSRKSCLLHHLKGKKTNYLKFKGTGQYIWVSPKHFTTYNLHFLLITMRISPIGAYSKHILILVFVY